MSREEDVARYHAAAHAMQSGVAAEMGIADRAHATEPKHLRVGVNSAMVNDRAIAELLIAKGVITEDEYVAAVADAMEAEAVDYEQRLQEYYGPGVRLW